MKSDIPELFNNVNAPFSTPTETFMKNMGVNQTITLIE